MADIELTSRRDACDRPGPGADEPERCAGARVRLSCDRIVDAAVRYVDHDCLDGLSMRRLGGELGVEAMSLYRYFPSKSALLGAVVYRMLSALALPAEGSGGAWEEAVRAYARSFRAISAAHPRLLPLLATMGPTNPALAAIDRRMVGLWQEAGFEAAVAAQAQSALQGYLTGTCLREAGAEHADGAFTLGLEALIAGLQARLGATPIPA